MNAGDWHEPRRYGVMAIEGYNDSAGSYDKYVRASARYAFDFYVIDNEIPHSEPLRKFTGRGKTLDAGRVQIARNRAIAHAKELNERERIRDMVHAS